MQKTKNILYNDFIKNPRKAINVLLTDKQLKDNNIVKKYEHETKYITFQYTQNFILALMASKIGTIISHYKRSLALSAPKNVRSTIFKYALIPFLFAQWLDHKRLQLLKQSCQDLKDNQLDSKYIQLLNTNSKIDC